MKLVGAVTSECFTYEGVHTQRDPIFKNTEERMAKGKELAGETLA